MQCDLADFGEYLFTAKMDDAIDVHLMLSYTRDYGRCSVCTAMFYAVRIAVRIAALNIVAI